MRYSMIKMLLFISSASFFASRLGYNEVIFFIFEDIIRKEHLKEETLFKCHVNVFRFLTPKFRRGKLPFLMQFS